MSQTPNQVLYLSRPAVHCWQSWFPCYAYLFVWWLDANHDVILYYWFANNVTHWIIQDRHSNRVLPMTLVWGWLCWWLFSVKLFCMSVQNVSATSTDACLHQFHLAHARKTSSSWSWCKARLLAVGDSKCHQMSILRYPNIYELLNSENLTQG